jgi:GNAT superfamily N-acetyltransferase
MPDLSYPDISFRPLDTYDDITSFHSTEQELDDFLHEDALDNQVNRLSVTFLASWNDNHVGYFSLINDSIVAEAVHESDREPSWEYRKYPAIKIARMARHRDFSGHGIGTIMLLRIFIIVLHVSQFSGCRIITVDSKPGAVEWYRKNGFTPAQVKPRDDTIPLYMDFHRFVSQEEQRML